MKIPLLILAAVAFLTGCRTREVVVYEQPVRRTVVAEPAGSVRVYHSSPSMYYYYAPKERLGGNYLGPRR